MGEGQRAELTVVEVGGGGLLDDERLLKYPD